MFPEKKTQVITPENQVWLVAPRELSEVDRLNAKLADLREDEAALLTPEELDQLAESAWMIVCLAGNSLGA